MNQPDMAHSSNQLVVFSDDWGRHPSSCQHLVQQLIAQTPTLWVNTIGMRLPRPTLGDLKKIATKCRQWLSPATDHTPLPANLQVINPRMYPGFRTGWQRRLNRTLLSRQINRHLQSASNQRIAITTLPITADLVGKLHVDRWIYYCVDDFSVWPGLDSRVMQEMEQQLVASVDRVIAVSDTLVKRLGAWSNQVDLLTHGIDLAHWQQTGVTTIPTWAQRQHHEMIFLFWGLIDPRLDISWCLKLAAYGKLVLVGPVESADPQLLNHPNIIMPGPMAYAQLPGIAQCADVLVMPYADLPVTRAMQPLKFKEYLATGKPIVARNLPAVLDWQDAADLVTNADAFVTAAVQRSIGGLPETQRQARKRLQDETWHNKAKQLANHLNAA
jgi:glycosyltransferase involved in cell wall biosynthesis